MKFKFDFDKPENSDVLFAIKVAKKSPSMGSCHLYVPKDWENDNVLLINLSKIEGSVEVDGTEMTLSAFLSILSL